jgi:ABC-type multidrug transport system ATPase subunit
MEIRLEGISKRFTREWIFKNFTHQFSQGKSYAITGPNGSGKSTLLMIAAGWLLSTEGKIDYYKGNRIVDSSGIYKEIDFIAPYLELIEDFTLKEFVNFHFRFNPLADGMSSGDFIREIFMDKEKDKYIRNFSSGMKQRLKLATGFYSANPVLFLDEPSSNLDETAKKWYFDQFIKAKSTKLLILASNDKAEFEKCDFLIKINNFKVTYN